MRLAGPEQNVHRFVTRYPEQGCSKRGDVYVDIHTHLRGCLSQLRWRMRGGLSEQTTYRRDPTTRWPLSASVEDEGCLSVYLSACLPACLLVDLHTSRG